MAIASAQTTQFWEDLLNAVIVDVFKVALITVSPSGSFGASTLNYSELGSDEVTGGGYTAGGKTLAGAAVAKGGGEAWLDFTDAQWLSATFSTDGALIYNTSRGNRSVAVFDFSGTKTVANGTFDIVFPVAAAATAIVRITQ